MPDNKAILEGVRRGLITPEKARTMLAPEPSVASDVVQGIGSGLVRGTPKLLDFAAGVTGEGLNQAQALVGQEPAPIDETFKNSTVFNDAVSAALGPEYQPDTKTGHVAKFVAELVGPGGVSKLAKNAIGFAKGAAGSLEGYIKDPEALKQAYRAWKAGLENVPVKAKELQSELVDPTLQEIGHDARYLTRDGKQKVGELKGLGQRDTTMGDVYALRKSLSKVDDSAAVEPIRNATKQFMEQRVGTGGLDQYRRAATYDDVQHALRNMDNEGIKATRTKINNLDEAGMTAAEKVAKRDAGRGGLAEALLSGSSRAMGAIPSAIVAGPFAPLVYGAGKGLGMVGDKLAKQKIQTLQEVLLNGRSAPNLGERGGAALRDALMKVRR